jgi:predicted transcriptional regulator/transcriptional regulator with XRE-family HTH domain
MVLAIWEGRVLATTPIGFRLRTARKKKSLTQTELAKRVGISVSYLNLIEHDKRVIAGGLLNRIAAELDLDARALSGFEDARLVQHLTDLTAEPLFRDIPLSAKGAQSIVNRDPDWARAIVRLHNAWRDANDLIEALSDQLNRNPFMAETSHEILTHITSIRSFAEILQEHWDLPRDQHKRFVGLLATESQKLSESATSLFQYMSGRALESHPATPAAEVDDFIIDNDNYFPELEAAADEIRGKLSRDSAVDERSLRDYLEIRHGVGVSFGDLPPGISDHPVSTPYFAHDRETRALIVKPNLPQPTLRFQLARVAFELEHGEMLEQTVADRRLRTDDARNRAFHAMARYGAGALLLPYDSVLNAAEERRYDIEALASRFCASFEQICHRLVTLKKNGARAIPFAFLRTDPAGNTSKIFSLPELRLPRHGSACSMWAIYRAFQTPGRVIPQMIRLPDDREFLLIARTVAKEVQLFGAPQQIYSVMLACNAAYSDRLVYGDGLDPSSRVATTEAGISCRLCPRSACTHRAHAPILPVPKKETA